VIRADDRERPGGRDALAIRGDDLARRPAGGDAAAIRGEDLGRRLAGLQDVGRTASGGVTRLAWTDEDARSRVWFAAQARELGLRCERDRAGNLWACPDAPAPWWGVGSHLDSVRDGGCFDGPLGVAAAFEVAARASRPVAVISFADEEGARFNTPTFGSRALTGRLDVSEVLARTDDEGVTVREAMAAAGVDPGRLAEAPAALERLRGFLELHIDQSRALASANQPAAPVSALAARLRLQFELRGAADHAGTTPRDERRDAMAAAARLIVTADDLAAAVPGFVTTPTRLLVEPNAQSTIAERVRLWIDARAPEPEQVEHWREEVERTAAELAERTGVTIDAKVASWSPGSRFDDDVRRRLAEAGERLGHPAGEVICFAGHDAGVLAPHVPAGMVLVRNATGVSHAPGEYVELADAAVAATMMLHALEELA
jgi:beta-ureidopropionase / N-carbamoyl-L-amino-acid hydrolase